MSAARGSSIPVWTSNRGAMMMIRVALTQSGRLPVFVSSFGELQTSVSTLDPQHVIIGLDDLATCGLSTHAAVAGLKKDLQIIFLSIGAGTPDPGSAKAQILKVPFSAAELRATLESKAGGPGGAADREQPRASSPSDLTEIVRAEIERIIMEKAEAMVAEAVMKMVPELAETMIKTELQRLLAEEGDKAVTTEPGPDEDS